MFHVEAAYIQRVIASTADAAARAATASTATHTRLSRSLAYPMSPTIMTVAMAVAMPIRAV